MDDEHGAVIAMAEEIFGAPREPLDAAPRQALGKTLRKGNAQIGAVEHDPRERSAFEHGLQAAADGLDLGKLGHGITEDGRSWP